MGYSTSVRETWGPCFYNISQQGSLIPFLKIYGLCSGKETGNLCGLNASPTRASSQRPQEEAGAPALTATGTPRGGRRLVAVISWMESASGRTNHLTPSDFVCTSFPINSFFTPLTHTNPNS